MNHAATGQPNFANPPFAGAPVATFAPSPSDGVLPEGFYATSNLPTWVHTDRGWVSTVHPRMDGAVVPRGGHLEVLEPRRVRAGEPVLLGHAEDGSEGIVVSTEGFLGVAGSPNEFRFMSTEVSRERPVDYVELAERIESERRRGGYLVWVLGPALVHARARSDMEWFIRQGYVQAVLAGNAVAVHDIESAIFGTTLGMTNVGRPTEGGHSLHMRAINRVRAAGSIEAAVASGMVKDGIMHALVTQGIPYVLAGSIRDDGPLPGVITDNVAAQDAMRQYTIRATGAVFIATALHAIAVGNMLPAFHTHRGSPEPLMTLCVDQTEFVVNKLRDRGTHQAYGVVTNAQDFMHVIRYYTEQCRRS
jgi:lysine-ketoglutarate reductase/saccharopine dehydrogenase-like protein (TIGR00300 family)